nr:putative integron gene cassette protein [uncultured bacterium]
MSSNVRPRMKRFTIFSATAAAAIVGFLAGVFCAAQLGIYEATQVFGAASITSLLLASLVITLVPASYRRLGIAGRRVAALLSGALFAACATFFWHTIT